MEVRSKDDTRIFKRLEMDKNKLKEVIDKYGIDIENETEFISEILALSTVANPDVCEVDFGKYCTCSTPDLSVNGWYCHKCQKHITQNP